MKRSILTVIFIWTLVCSYIGCSASSSLMLSVPGSEQSPFTALNDNARQAAVPGGGSPYMYFGFSDKQRSALSAFALREGAVSVEIELSAVNMTRYADTAAGERRFAFGLLYAADFTKSGKLASELADRPMVSGVFSAANRRFRISQVITPSQISSVRGFFVYSAMPAEAASVSVIPCETGFDFSEIIPRFCFAGSGGTVPENGSEDFFSFDFTDSAQVFSSASADGAFIPVFTVKLRDIGSRFGSAENQVQVRMSFGGERIGIRRAPEQFEVTLHTGALQSPFGPMSAGTNADMITGVSLRLIPSECRGNGTAVQPLKTDPGLIPAWKKTSWREKDYELFEWEQFPGLLYFDTADYGVQDDFFKRLAFFTEKNGYIGTLVSDAVLEDKHGFNAHDYRPETLASFFSLAEKTAFPLSEKEMLLKEILLYNGIIAADSRNGEHAGYLPGQGGVISISQESPMYLRHSFIAHEGLHGLYFIDSDFRAAVSRVFNSMDPRSLQFLIRYFQIQPSLNYNIDDTYLLENEFMAYIMQQPVSNTANYFVTRAGWNSMTAAEPELCAYVRKTGGSGFTQAAEQLNAYVFRRWGLAAGRVSLVTR